MFETFWVKKGHVCHNWVWWGGGVSTSSAVSGLLESTTLSYHKQPGFHKYVKNVMHLLNVAMAVGNLNNKSQTIASGFLVICYKEINEERGLKSTLSDITVVDFKTCFHVTELFACMHACYNLDLDLWERLSFQGAFSKWAGLPTTSFESSSFFGREF